MADFNKNIADALVGELGGLLNQVESLMNSLPNEAKSQIPTAQMDIAGIREKMSNGDTQAINDIVKKYSNPGAFATRKK